MGIPKSRLCTVPKRHFLPRSGFVAYIFPWLFNRLFLSTSKSSKYRDALDATLDTSQSAGYAIGHVPALVVLALALGTVHALLRCEVTDGLQKTALADLAGDEAVDAILQGIDLLDACDL